MKSLIVFCILVNIALNDSKCYNGGTEIVRDERFNF